MVANASHKMVEPLLKDLNRAMGNRGFVKQLIQLYTYRCRRTRIFSLKLISNSPSVVIIANNHSCLKAMIGSTFAALAAGYSPKTIPTPTLIKNGSNMLSTVITVGILAK